MSEIHDMAKSIRESFGVPEDWSREESLKRVKAAVPGTFTLMDELLAAYVHLNRNEFARYCSQLGRTTRRAKALFTDYYGMSWQFAKKDKPKSKSIRNKPSVKRTIATDWLYEFLSAQDGYAIPARVCQDRARAQGISPRTLQRAKVYADVECFHRDRQWWWHLSI